MSGRIVVFGATGYTGRLVTAALVRAGERPVVAGRRAESLAELAAEHDGLSTAVADTSDPASVRALIEAGDVLVTTVGPFAIHGHAALDAAVDAGAHYVDSTGEAGFVRRVFDAGPRADRSGATLVTACGYDYVPGHLATALAVEAAGSSADDVRELRVVYSGIGVGISSGTRASAALMLTESTHRLEGGRLVERPTGRDVSGSSILTGGTEPLTAQRQWPGVTDVSVWLDLGRTALLARPASYVVPVLLAVPGLRERVRRAGGRTGSGPTVAERARTTSDVVAVASDADGRELGRGRVTGPNPYDLTATTMAAAAQRLAERGLDGAGAEGTSASVRTGAIGPLELFAMPVRELVARLGLRVG